MIGAFISSRVLIPGSTVFISISWLHLYYLIKYGEEKSMPNFILKGCSSRLQSDVLVLLLQMSQLIILVQAAEMMMKCVFSGAV